MTQTPLLYTYIFAVLLGASNFKESLRRAFILSHTINVLRLLTQVPGPVSTIHLIIIMMTLMTS